MNRLYWTWALTAVVLGSLLGWVLASWTAAATPRSIEPALISPQTATAIANMTAVAQQHGAAHRAFVIVPLVCGFFIDIVNALIISALVG